MTQYMYPATCNKCGKQSGTKNGKEIEVAVPMDEDENYICPDCIKKTSEIEQVSSEEGD